jgi:hypothetical protein
MDAVLGDLRTELDLDFTRARVALQEARHSCAAKDTPASRAAVEQCRAWIDAVLDLYLDMVGTHTVGTDAVGTSTVGTSTVGTGTVGTGTVGTGMVGTGTGGS